VNHMKQQQHEMTKPRPEQHELAAERQALTLLQILLGTQPLPVEGADAALKAACTHCLDQALLGNATALELTLTLLSRTHPEIPPRTLLERCGQGDREATATVLNRLEQRLRYELS
jgi:hypothetical protein